MTSVPNYYSSNRNIVKLGNQLGKGGEGAVFEIQNSPGLVAKIYHQTPDAKQASKLKKMVDNKASQLGEVAAWPTDVLWDSSYKNVLGLIMPKITGYREIHTLYGPAHRKRDFPKADWAFLIQAARNVAYTFDVIHSHNHTIGDVNQGNILVTTDATCKLIDCDSFQISSGGQIYACDVGVPQFTAPELQNKPFRGSLRTHNHDNFGLALICFHLLFMGRHPFAGRYSGPKDMPIERAISEFRYAYGSSAASKKMAPPPNTLGVSTLPYRLNLLFERAFNDEPDRSIRPTPKEWIQELDALKRGLKTCGSNPVHKFFGQLNQCPWCSLEQSSGVIYFLIARSPVSNNVFDIKRIWANIEVLQLSYDRNFPVNIPYSSVTPVPLPPRETGFLAFLSSLFFDPFREERKRRGELLNKFKREWEDCQNNWRYANWNYQFNQKKDSLRKQYQEWNSLKKSYDLEKTDAALMSYLEGFFIEVGTISGIGSGLVMRLKSWGIETAADITVAKVKAVDGFGEKRTKDLMNWRSQIEVQFKRNPVIAKSTPLLDQRYNQQRFKLEKSLSGGVEELQLIKLQIDKQRSQLLAQCRQIAFNLAQAEADASL